MNWDKLFEKIEGFDWDIGNINKNFIHHDITDKESEEIFFNPRLSYPDSKHSMNEARYTILGQPMPEKYCPPLLLSEVKKSG